MILDYFFALKVHCDLNACKLRTLERSSVYTGLESHRTNISIRLLDDKVKRIGTLQISDRLSWALEMVNVAQFLILTKKQT